MSDPVFVVLPDKDAVSVEAADRFIAAAVAAIDDHGTFRVALSGGTTPNMIYPLLASAPRVGRVDWSRVEFFWGDERCVPPDHPDSNFGNAYRMLISRLPGVRPDRIHRMPAESPDLEVAALTYEGELRLAFDARGTTPPSFDLMWLGMGPDGHTASLFPGTSALREARRWVVPNWVGAGNMWRMTLTLPVLNAAREINFLVAGENKARAVQHVRSGRSRLPAARVHAASVAWLLDAQAAGQAPATGDPG
jgi:6-phosphogluconolactonase